MHDGGVNLMIHQGSAGNVEDVRKVKEAAGKRPVRGVVQGAMALHVRLEIWYGRAIS
jgi:hypothetical protein